MLDAELVAVQDVARVAQGGGENRSAAELVLLPMQQMGAEGSHICVFAFDLMYCTDVRLYAPLCAMLSRFFLCGSVKPGRLELREEKPALRITGG